MTDTHSRLLQVLASGGDDRIALDGVSGLNLYGFGAGPRPDDMAFSSSTASSISTKAFARAATCYDRIVDRLGRENEIAVYEDEIATMRRRLQGLLGIETASVILAASGTDLHLFAAHLFSRREQKPLLTITLDGSETGSAVASAAAGCHFMHQAAGGGAVAKGQEISLGEDIRHVSLAVRDADGVLRPAQTIETELEAVIAEAERDGRHCLLMVTDVSKTGLIAPGLDTVFRLRARFANRLDVMIDACQFRISPATVRAYLGHGFLVAVTGSKFLGGPIFSGALLCPAGLSRVLRHQRLAPGLSDYSGQAEWPEGWAARQALPRRANWGLLLRWQAALFELEAFLGQSDARVRTVVQAFAQAVTERLEADPAFIPLTQQALDRSVLGVVGASYDALPTIFSFYPRDAAGNVLTPSQTRDLHQRLALQEGVRLGQPVACGASLLRLCLSAPLIVAACQDDRALQHLIDRSMRALDRVSAVAKSYGLPVKAA